MASEMPGRVLISEAHDEAYMSDLHAYLSIYGFIGSLVCRTVLAWQAGIATIKPAWHSMGR